MAPWYKLLDYIKYRGDKLRPTIRTKVFHPELVKKAIHVIQDGENYIYIFNDRIPMAEAIDTVNTTTKGTPSDA